jgi:hypothetical protein
MDGKDGDAVAFGPRDAARNSSFAFRSCTATLRVESFAPRPSLVGHRHPQSGGLTPLSVLHVGVATPSFRKFSAKRFLPAIIPLPVAGKCWNHWVVPGRAM